MPPLNEAAYFDLVVIGGGILGLTAALRAHRERPDWSLLVIERGMPGDGATRWSAALSVAYAATPRHRELVEESLASFREAPLSAYVRPLPALVIVSRAAADELQSGIVTGPLSAAAESDRKALMEAYPDLLVHAGEELLTATGTVFTVDVPALVHDALAAGPRLAYWSGARAVRVRRAARGFAVETQAGLVAGAARVVIATGPWPPPPVEGAPPPEGIRIKRVAALHLARPPGDLPAVFFPESDCFLLPQRHDILFSFPRDVWLSPSPESTGNFEQADLEAGLAFLQARSESLAAAVMGGRAFCDSYAPDRLPLVETHPAAPGVVWLLGGSGSGVRLAPALAARAVSALGGSPDP